MAGAVTPPIAEAKGEKPLFRSEPSGGTDPEDLRRGSGLRRRSSRALREQTAVLERAEADEAGATAHPPSRRFPAGCAPCSSSTPARRLVSGRRPRILGGIGVSESSGRNRDWFFVGLATLSFIADLYTVYQIVAKEIVFDFWTWRWIIAIILVALLAVGGFTFLAISGSEDSAAALLFIFGVLYTIGSLIVYLYWAFRAIGGPLIASDFFGFLTLFAILTTAGIFGVAYEKDNAALRFPSYGYATASLAYVVLLVNEYVGMGASFIFWSFAGQVVILLIGIILFISLYVEATGTSNR